MTNLKTYCVTDVPSENLEKLDLTLVGVGNKKFSNKYIKCEGGINIQEKEKYYSELTFHYWFWKNELDTFDHKIWIGFCQKRRFWLKDNKNIITNISDLNENILRSIPNDWDKYDAIICDPIKVSPAKKMKLIKRGWRNWIRNPLILLDVKKHNIKLQFDMFHGYGLLDEAVNLLKKEQKDAFKSFLNNNIEFNPHIMVISKKTILNRWFSDLFEWLFNCEKLFGFEKLVGYDKGRLYAYLAERYLSFWFNHFYNSKSHPWLFYDTIKLD